MVKRTINVITSKINGLGEAAFWLALFSFFSLILALLRDRMLAYNFGAGLELDIYYASFKVPDLIFVTVASLVSISALVPLFAKKQTEGERHLKDSTDSVFSVFAILIIAFCLLAYFLMPIIIKFFYSTLSPSSITEIIFLSRVLLLSPLLLGFSNFFGSIVQYEKRFILYSISPILYNLGIILGIFFLTKKIGVSSAVFGVILGAFMHLLLQAFFVMQSKLKPRFVTRINWRDVLEVGKLSVPRTLALSITSFVGFLFAVLASRMETGSIAIFNLSWNLQSAPISLIGVSFSLAAFPALAVSFAKKDMADVINKISSGIRQIIFWSLPLTVFIILLRAHITRVVLGSGSFDWLATRLVSASLALFALSIVFQSIVLFLSRSHYALGKTKWPFYGNILGGVVSVLFAVLFYKYFDDFRVFFALVAEILKVPDLSLKVLSLPFAFSLGSIFSALLLFFGLGRELVFEIWISIRRTIIESIIGAFACGVGVYLGLLVFSDYFTLETFWGVLGHGFIAGMIGILSTAFVFRILGSREIAGF
jgi:putative peptidoglycan lipid II flippase